MGRNKPVGYVVSRIALFATTIWVVVFVLVLSPSLAQSDLSVVISDVVVEGGVPELADATEALVASFRGRRVTVAELQALAHTVELLYQEAGYFLVRVTIPPQEINDGDPFRLLVLDGYLEAVDVQGIPEPVRPYLESVFKPLLNQNLLKYEAYERAMMVARDTPGLSIETTMVPGEGTGAALLAVDGTWKRIDGSFSLKRHLSQSGSPWNASLKLQLNQPFGRGEQVTANVSAPVTSIFSRKDSDEKNRTVGANVRWPIGTDGMSLNVGFNESHTYTPPPHPIIPATSTEFSRLSIEFNNPVQLTRADELRVSLTLDETDQAMKAPDFDMTFYHDRLRVIRIGATNRRETTTGSRLSTSLQLSQGIKWGGRTDKDVQESKIPTSRPRASLTFQKVTLTLSERMPLGEGTTLTSTLRTQLVVKGPLPTTELFGLSGDNALPSLALGVGSNDTGWTLREQIDKPLSFSNPNLQLSLYAYGAIGGGENVLAGTSGFASALGVGIRGDVGRMHLSLEYGRGRSRSASDHAVVASMEVAF